MDSERISVQGWELDKMQAMLLALSQNAECRKSTKAAARRAAKALRALSCSMDEDASCRLFGGGTRMGCEFWCLADSLDSYKT